MELYVEWLDTILGFIRYVLTALLIYSIFLVIERVRPAESHQPFHHILLELGMLAFIELLWLQFIHMNLRVGFGIFDPILVGPQHHRIHHSLQAQHLDKNFVLFFPLWDIVFGSYYRPQKGEFPTTGLTTRETYTDLWSAITWSFRAVTIMRTKTGLDHSAAL